MSILTIRADCALIDRLGGPTELSRLTGYSVQRIANWKTRGIPDAARVKFPGLFWLQHPDGRPLVDYAARDRADAPPVAEERAISLVPPSVAEEGVRDAA